VFSGLFKVFIDVRGGHVWNRFQCKPIYFVEIIIPTTYFYVNNLYCWRYLMRRESNTKKYRESKQMYQLKWKGTVNLCSIFFSLESFQGISNKFLCSSTEHRGLHNQRNSLFADFRFSGGDKNDRRFISSQVFLTPGVVKGFIQKTTEFFYYFIFQTFVIYNELSVRYFKIK